MKTSNKTNLKSIRLCDEILTIIEAQRGENFNQKVENLVIDFKVSATEREAYIKSLDEKIEQMKNRLKQLHSAIDKAERIKSSLDIFMKNMESIIKS